MHLNHTIVYTHDKNASSTFLSEMLGLPRPRQVGPFCIVQVDADLSLDYMDAEGTVQPQHHAFLVSEAEFDSIFSRVVQRGLEWWSDPGKTQVRQINTWDGGRGVYFDDPSGHLIELITRSYGSGGTTSKCPNPVFKPINPT